MNAQELERARFEAALHVLRWANLEGVVEAVKTADALLEELERTASMRPANINLHWVADDPLRDAAIAACEAYWDRSSSTTTFENAMHAYRTAKSAARGASCDDEIRARAAMKERSK